AWGMSNAAATLVGQNLGAGQPDRAEVSVWKTGKYNALFMGIISLFYLVFAKNILGWLSNDVEVVEQGALCLQVIALGYVFYAYGMVVMQAFNGAGDTTTPTWINLISFWLFQLPMAYVVALVLDYRSMGVFLSITVAEIFLAILAMIWFKKGNLKRVEV